MREKLLQRLELLQHEMAKGQDLLASIQQQERELQDQILRIAGAMQVIKELLVAEEEPDHVPDVPRIEFEEIEE